MKIAFIRNSNMNLTIPNQICIPQFHDIHTQNDEHPLNTANCLSVVMCEAGTYNLRLQTYF